MEAGFLPNTSSERATSNLRLGLISPPRLLPDPLDVDGQMIIGVYFATVHKS